MINSSHTKTVEQVIRLIILITCLFIKLDIYSQNSFTTIISWDEDTSLRFFNHDVFVYDSSSFYTSTSTILNKDTSGIFFEGDFVNGTVITKLNYSGEIIFSKLYQNNTFKGFHDGLSELGRDPSIKCIVENGFIYLPSSTLVGWEYGTIDSNSKAISSRPFLMKIDANTGDVILDTLLTHYNPYASDVEILDLTSTNDTLVLVYQDRFQNTIIIDKINLDLEVISTVKIDVVANQIQARFDRNSGSLISSNYYTNISASEILSTSFSGSLNWYRYYDLFPLSNIKIIDGVMWGLATNNKVLGNVQESFIFAISIENGIVLKSIKVDGILLDFDVRDSIIIAIREKKDDLVHILKIQMNGQVVGFFGFSEEYLLPNQIFFVSSNEWVLTGTILKSNLYQEREKDKLYVVKSSLSVIQGLPKLKLKEIEALLYPNPVTKIINITSIPFDIKSLSVNITSVNGAVLISMSHLEVNNGRILTEISVEELPKGVYFLTLESESGFLTTIKFVK